MNRNDFIHLLEQCGLEFLRHGSIHDIYIHSEKLSYQYRVTLRIFARGVFGMKPTDTNFYTAAAIFPPIHNFNGVAASVKAHE